eukprot:Blabericola_migrator_1__8453@NODE_4407_length_1177_cov_9_232432_g2726_i0_p1_GENE_NODE_4407_length_1177_cov_9_232432_g2726_i0NODE_4407_length_1177_cov_9_232432_g2726_i0_p1_ORF_typecomplete_len246_score22_08rve/PF00665_26/9_9e08rve_3/PF13683_6/0_037rve_3/PF13683_6/6_7e02MLVIN_C/PF18697_1/0_068_NODE_4407_length_1177_cov_9_232432_g2726_i04051142
MILTDNAAYFTCRFFAAFLRKFNTLVTHSAPWHPQGHAHIERFNRQLQQALRMDENPLDWDIHLPQALYNHNQITCDTTGFAPLELLINRPKPPTIILEDLLKDITDRREELRIKRQAALERMEAQQNLALRRRNQGRYEHHVKQGDYITIRTHDNMRFGTKFEGCYEVKKVVGTTLHYEKEGQLTQINVSDVHVIPKEILDSDEEMSEIITIPRNPIRLIEVEDLPKTPRRRYYRRRPTSSEER